MKFKIFLFVISLLILSCMPKEEIRNENLKKVVLKIKNSDIYENSINWEKRGLHPSNEDVIKLLREETNNFLDKLVRLDNSEISDEEKLKKVNHFVDNLPWNELDTEEREFMADVLAPAIEAIGYNPWLIF